MLKKPCLGLLLFELLTEYFKAMWPIVSKLYFASLQAWMFSKDSPLLLGNGNAWVKAALNKQIVLGFVLVISQR